MARQPRIAIAGLTYHVWVHGIDELPIFKTTFEKDRMLTFLREEVELSNWTCLSYVVMTTHYHVVLRLNEETLSSGFQRLNARFAQWFNREYGRRGHVFESRYGCRIVDSQHDQLEVCRYVALNPTRAQMCRLPEHYGWSGYGAIVGHALPDDVVDINAARTLAGSRLAFKRFVEEVDPRVRWGQARARPRTTRRAA
ncbi:MAG TPA: transposase [Gaiellaceae bacterium]|nr:transposase [Gaiellaceae bacterium]